MSKESPSHSLLSILPFWSSLLLLPVMFYAAVTGGWSFLWVIILCWGLFSVLDVVLGINPVNHNPNTEEKDLIGYTLVTLIWPPLHFITLFGLLWYVGQSSHTFAEKVGLFYAVGVLGGVIGINYSHELMHRSDRLRRHLADGLLAMVLYSHFRSEHLLVHHKYVGTPRDGATARYGESYYAFFTRALAGGLPSAFHAECQKLKKSKRAWYHIKNPFYKYLILQTMCLALACMIGGAVGVALFVWQAFIAINILEITNYIEHYALTRKYLGNGRYEPVKPHHSWNTGLTATNWFFINLQRHSDHHVKPNRPYPLLQTYDDTDAPQFKYGYIIMGLSALIPPLWRHMIDPKVLVWRERFYREIEDWSDYDNGVIPLPVREGKPIQMTSA